MPRHTIRRAVLAALVAALAPGLAAAQTAAPAPTQAPTQAPTEAQRRVGQLFELYATVNGAWVLDQRCRVLDREGRREYEWHLARLNIAMARQFGQKKLAPLQRAAAETAEDPKYDDCGAAPREIVGSAAALVRNADVALTKGAYDRATSYRDYVSVRYAGIEASRRVDARCGHVPDDVKDNIAAAHAWVAQRIETLWGTAHRQSLDRRAGDLAARDALKTCGTETAKAVHAAAGELRVLYGSLKADETLAE
ncbi:MAG: hypothetical protein H6907_03330 [Hyphomicrobiales bacterium]|nr:hypothetical protein [Hyphomicrobiales bacterium]MCP5370740.1 hypothetical protein [Hyphomicrobiales bacterium]